VPLKPVFGRSTRCFKTTTAFARFVTRVFERAHINADRTKKDWPGSVGGYFLLPSRLLS
jgi:hypothetical protein